MPLKRPQRPLTQDPDKLSVTFIPYLLPPLASGASWSWEHAIVSIRHCSTASHRAMALAAISPGNCPTWY